MQRQLKCFRLTNHALTQLFLHAEELVTLALKHFLYRYTGPARNNTRDVLIGHFLTQEPLLRRFGCGLEALLKLRNLTVLQLPRAA